ncbi:hypothetical protein W97_03463 [Coniosporium apollinis CBS 100218]|uniref:GABA permease n=1 Tax=Coniosporium apollinis (strain CBS 100218) TaxID=1168221 RepID=R7YQP8_CONA1|nr:uncharacterized protein W97_03463 [Coniosporium apollinis CBS 100218]EON64232.1 hypothetical protein W97_03463 [Coniosporium apollinis CBS 100218]
MATSSRQSDPINDGGKDLYHESVAEIMPHPPPTPLDEDYDKHDEKDMSRMGKKQELRRNFRRMSTLSFTSLIMATWEFVLISNLYGMIDGGLAGLFWSYVWTAIGFGFVIASLAEMASMAPTSGGQYHWVSEFAPPQYQKFLSYIVGWQSTLSWQAGTASGSFLTGTIIQGMITINNPDYEPQNWHGTLLIFSMVIILYVFNTWTAEWLPDFQNILMILHVFGFIAVVVVLWVLGPHPPASAVFLEFQDFGGWSSMGLSLMVGQISAIFCLICSDSAAHMSEEVKNAGVVVPRSMMWSYIMNGSLGFIMLVSLLFSIPDVEAAIDDPTGYPFLWVFQQTMPTRGTNVLTTVILLLVIAGNISVNASTSRQTYAFARDRGLVFNDWIARVHPKLLVPANAVTLTCIFTILLALINLGSTVAFNAIISLQLVALMFSYFVSIGCVLYKRIQNPKALPECRWSLGRFGPAINLVAILYSAFAFFWCFWPNEASVTVDNFNWAIVIFMGTFVISLIMYFTKGRKEYDGPVISVEGFLAERRMFA